MFRKHLISLVALLSVALHATDALVAVMGHSHAHDHGACCTTAEVTPEQHAADSTCGHSHGHSHSHGGCHSHSHAIADHESAPATQPKHSHSHHDDCAICRHLALTPALVAPPIITPAPVPAEAIAAQRSIEIPPARIILTRSRAPPGSVA